MSIANPTKRELAVLKARAALNNVIVVDAATPATTPVQEDTTSTMQTIAASTDFVGSINYGIPTSDSGVSTDTVVPFVTDEERAALDQIAADKVAADAAAADVAAFGAQNTPAAPAAPTAMAALDIALRVLDAVNTGTDLSMSPGEVAGAATQIRELIAAATTSSAAPAATSGATRNVARTSQPPLTMGSDGKLLRKMWLHNTPDAATFGPYIVGDTTKVGWVVRDTQTGADTEFGRGATYKAEALALAAQLADDIDPALYDALEAAAKARIVADGSGYTAR